MAKWQQTNKKNQGCCSRDFNLQCPSFGMACTRLVHGRDLELLDTI